MNTRGSNTDIPSDLTLEKTIVWVIEDHPRFQKQLIEAFGNHPDIDCAFATPYCEDAIEKVSRGERPDVILMDINLKGMSGIEGTQKIKALDMDIHIIALTINDDVRKITDMLLAGASGYLIKPSSKMELIHAVKSVQEGGAPLTPALATMFIDFFMNHAPQMKRSGKDYQLSDREQEVLSLLSRGKTKKEVASLTNTSPHTVDTHIRRIYKKLDVNNRSGAVAKAIREGLVNLK